MRRALLPRNECLRYILSTGREPGRKDPKMHPLRAFLFSLTCGLALLFSLRGLVYAMEPSPDQRVGSGPIQVPTA